MKDYLIFAIFMYLIKKRQTNAKDIANEFDISPRSVYRYIDTLSLMGIPVITKMGRGGGIEIIGNFYLENVMLSLEEKVVLFEYIQHKDLPTPLLKILKKLI